MYQICSEARVFYIMINEKSAKKFCCEDLSLIENYELAINDTTQTWHCHHILGEQYDRKYLIDNNLYENRPASEFRFVTLAEHNSLHKRGVPKSEAHKKALSKALKGVPLSEAHKKAVSEALKGVPKSEATKKAIGEGHSKKILQFTKSGKFIKEWPSAMEASRQLGIVQPSICNCCNRKRKYAGCYVWRYA